MRIQFREKFQVKLAEQDHRSNNQTWLPCPINNGMTENTHFLNLNWVSDHQGKSDPIRSFFNFKQACNDSYSSLMSSLENISHKIHKGTSSFLTVASPTRYEQDLIENFFVLGEKSKEKKSIKNNIIKAMKRKGLSSESLDTVCSPLKKV